MTLIPQLAAGAVHEEIALLPRGGYAARRNVWMVTLDVAPSAPALVAAPARGHDLESLPAQERSIRNASIDRRLASYGGFGTGDQ
jgi:hypothetical protein